MSNLFRITRVLVVIGSITVLLLVLTMWSQFLAVSTDAADSSYDWFFLILVGPGILIVLGAFLQMFYRKPWVFIFILIGGVCNLVFVGLNIHFLFVYMGEKRGLLRVYADLAVMALTLGMAFLNIFADYARPKTVSNNSLGSSGDSSSPK